MNGNDETALALLIPIFAIVFGLGLPVLGWIVVRAMAYRERMEMIRHGMVPPPIGSKEWRGGSVPSRPPNVNPATYDLDAAQCTLRKGVTVFFVGMALTAGLSFIGWRGDQLEPGPWLLGGLIPMFVGLAQITTALLSGASFRPPHVVHGAPPAYGMPPQPPPPGAPSATPTYEASYTYRPGQTQELRPPPAPPDRI